AAPGIDFLARKYGSDGGFDVAGCLVYVQTGAFMGGDGIAGPDAGIAFLTCADAAARWEDMQQAKAVDECNQAWRPTPGMMQALWALCPPQAATQTGGAD